MSLRETKIDQHAITQVLGDEAFELPDGAIRARMESGDDISQILWVQSYGQCRRANEIAEHHRELTTLSFGRTRRGPNLGCLPSDRDNWRATLEAELMCRRVLGSTLTADPG